MEESYLSISVEKEQDGTFRATAVGKSTAKSYNNDGFEEVVIRSGLREFIVESDSFFFESEDGTETITINDFNNVLRISFDT